jgi:branched-chain amino acid aminotransferase
MQRISLNGRLVSPDELLATPLLRGAYYGDGLFESMRIHQGRINFWSYHRDRLLRGMEYLGMQFPEHWSADRLPELITTTVGDWPEARLRLTVVRSPGGLYTPESDEVHFLAEALSMEGDLYPLNDTGWTIGYYHDTFPLAGSTLSNLKTCNALPYILGARFRKKEGLDDVLLTNQHGRVVEGTAWNLFCRKAKTLYTPPLSEGPLDGVMRRVVLEVAPNIGWEVQEQALSPAFLAEAGSIYLTNAVKGVQWVEWLDGGLYSNNGAVELRKAIMMNA